VNVKIEERGRGKQQEKKEHVKGRESRRRREERDRHELEWCPLPTDCYLKVAPTTQVFSWPQEFKKNRRDDRPTLLDTAR